MCLDLRVKKCMNFSCIADIFGFINPFDVQLDHYLHTELLYMAH